MKKFLLSIDTEGDSLWSWKKGDIIKTENAKYLDRFQSLCNNYGFKPTYLTNYEMISDLSFAKWLKEKSLNKELEVGMHLHDWSTPPYVQLENCSSKPCQPYLIEHTKEVMREKIDNMTTLLEDSVEQPIITHRSGRWAMDERYFELLAERGYQVDCSVTPHMDWSAYGGETCGSKGSDYSNNPEQPYLVKTPSANIIEVPVTVRVTHKPFIVKKDVRGVLGSIKSSIKGQKVWLRPNGKNLNQMLWLVDNISNDKSTEYLMFMLHSSEFMPGGSPNFKDESAVEQLYKHLEIVFKKISEKFEGETIGDFGVRIKRGLEEK